MSLRSGKPQTVTFDGNSSEVVVRKRGGNRIVGTFSAISVLTNKKRARGRMQQQDVFDRLDQVSKGAFRVFNNLKFNRSEEDNITQYKSPVEMGKTDREVLSRRLRELKEVDLIRSVKKVIQKKDSNQAYTFKDPRTTFIINPTMIRCNNHDEAVYLWDQCARK